MPFHSSYISQQIGAQNAMFSGQAAYAQQLAYPMQQAQPGGRMMPPPPPMAPPQPMGPPPMSMVQGLQGGQGGMYGEQMAMRMAGVGRSAWGVGTASAGLGMAAAGLDPLSMGLRAGMAGGGMMGGMAMAGAVAAPMYMAGRVADHYGGQFMGGMQQQAQLNSTLRGNFQHMGGQGRMGRGFSQGQMGQIGSVIQSELSTNVFSNASEMNQLVQGGAQSGMFSGVRDVQQFTQRFRRMLDTLKSVQEELGGSLSDALSFVRQSRQSGIFQQADRSNFAGEIRGAEANTGMSRGQLLGLSSAGASLSRQVGGHGRQGAYGALRTASTLGAAIQTGAINEEQLSEATGGLQGAEAVQAFTMRMMQRSARFSRRGAGRFSMYAMSNADGTGLDQEAMSRFMAGDLSTGQVSRRAHRNVGRMGRARAINQEGTLRGAMLEQGGLAGQIGMMRLAVGDRVLDQGDDRAQLWMQRRMGMSRPESELMSSLMRNQGSIAQEESFGRQAAGRQQALQTDTRENRSIEAFSRSLSHSVQEATGSLQTRNMGRKFVSRISDMAERVMNDVLGISENRLTSGDQSSLNRMSMGRATDGDMERLNLSSLRGGTSSMTGGNLFSRGLLQTGRSPGDILQRRGGNNVAGMSAGEAQTEVRAAEMARGGELILERDQRVLERLNAAPDRTVARIQRAQLIASGTEAGMGNFYAHMGKGGSANATDAFLNERGMTQFGDTLGSGALMRRSGGQITGGMAARDAGRIGVGGLAGYAAARLMGGSGEHEMESFAAVRTGADAATNFFASGGEMAQNLRRGGARSRSLVERNGLTNGMLRGGISAIAAGAGPLGGTLEALGGMLPGTREAGSDANRMLEAIEGVDSDSMRAVLGSEGVRSRMGRILGADGNAEQMQAEIAQFRRYAGEEFNDPGQATAAFSLIEQIQSGMGGGTPKGGKGVLQNGKQGRLSAQVRQMLQSGSVDPERQQQLRDRMTQIGGDYSNLGRSMGGAMGERFQNIGSQFMQFQDASGDINDARFDIARMDTDSQEYRDATSGMGSSEFGRNFLGGVANDRQRDRALAGRGRRGRHQRSETALGMLTGNSLSEMSLSVGGRELGARNRAGRVDAILQRGGPGADELMQQMTQQLTEAGVSGAGGMLQTYRGAMEDGSLDADERRDMIQNVGSNADLQRVQREAIDRRQRQQNPLDTARNDLLTRIADGVGAMARNQEPGEPPGEPGG